MNLGQYPTFFDNFYFVRQNNCQFRWDENIENIATYFSLFSVVKSIFVKIQHNSCNEFMSWSPKFPDVSLLDVTWSVSLTLWRQSRTSKFQVFWFWKNEKTSNHHNFWSRQDFESGESAEWRLNKKVSNFQKSQHLLSSGQHLLTIGRVTWRKPRFLSGFFLFAPNIWP